MSLQLLCMLVAARAACALRVTLVGGGLGNASVVALHASSTPPMPVGSFALVAARSPCALPPAAARPDGAFALLLERGGCSFDDKMGLALAAGASALIVADSLTYRDAGPNASSPPWMVISDPCAVDCALGSVRLDSTTLSRSDVISGLQAQCGQVCGGRACGFADPPPAALEFAAPVGETRRALDSGMLHCRVWICLPRDERLGTLSERLEGGCRYGARHCAKCVCAGCVDMPSPSDLVPACIPYRSTYPTPGSTGPPAGRQFLGRGQMAREARVLRGGRSCGYANLAFGFVCSD